jgi:hypothetical protein
MLVLSHLGERRIAGDLGQQHGNFTSLLTVALLVKPQNKLQKNTLERESN